jgi:hypothetical protein
MRNETASVPFGAQETPPTAPYDPPQPAPQAEAWRRALKVVGCCPPRRTAVRTTVRRVKSMRHVNGV